MLATKSIITFVPGLISPSLYTVAMLQVVLPHALVLRTIHVLVDSASISFIVSPVSIIDVTVNMNESTLAMSSVFSPLARVLGTITPSLLSEAIAETTLPLACVDGESLESVGRSLFTGLICIVDPLSHRLTCLLLREVLATTYLLSLQHVDESASSVSSPGCLKFHNESHLRQHELGQIAIVSALVCQT